MKFNWKWVFENSFVFVILIGCILALFSIDAIPIIWASKVFIYAIAVASMMGCITVLFCEIPNGETFYSYSIIPIEDFKIDIYDNMICIAYDNHVWTYTYKKDEISKLKEIKAIYFYNIKKVQVKWDILPYQQLKKRKDT